MSTATLSAPRTLAEELRARSDQELTELLRARPDLLTPPPADITALAARATTRVSVARAVDGLDRFTLQVLEAIAILPEPAGPAGVRTLLGVSAAAVRPALTRLHERALIWGPPREVRLVRAVADVLGPYPAGLGPPLAVALAGVPESRRTRLAADLRPGDAGSDADAVAAAGARDAADLADAIMGRLADLLGELSDDATTAVQTLAGGPPSGRVERAGRDVDRGTARTPIDELLARGLVVPTDDVTVVLPREIGLHVRGGRLYPTVHPAPPVPDPVATHDPQVVDRTAGSGAFDAARRVEVLLELWGHEPPPVLRTGGLGLRDLRRLPSLIDTDEQGAALIVELAYVTGLVAPGGPDGDRWLPTTEYDTWLRGDPAARWATVVTSWLGTSRVVGLVGSRGDRDRVIAPMGPGIDRPFAAEVRRSVLDVLAALPRGAVPEPTDVVDSVRWYRPRRSGRIADDLVRWTLRELEAIGLTGLGALAAHATPLLDGRPAEAAMKAAAAALAVVLPEPLDHVLVQADLTAIAPGPLRPDLARDLAAMSEVESRGGASVHRFTAESIRRALDLGWTAAELHEFVTRVSRTPVPQPLTYLINDVARKHGRLRVGAAAAFIRCDDPAVVATIMADPRAVALGARRIAPTVLASSLDPATLVERLREVGLSPNLEGTDGAIVVARAEPGRASRVAPPAPLAADRPTPTDALLAATIRAVRSGERSAASRPPAATARGPGRTAAGETLAGLRIALDASTSVWIGYVDQHGTTSERVVDPLRIEGGQLTAFDHRSGEVRSFAIHRISGMSPIG